jgi:MoaA/NifB/PqqE/SkfB family radical SAM enzyme
MFKKLPFLVRTSARALDYKVRGKRRPLIVSLTLSNICNLKCTYCYADSWLRKRVEYEPDEIIRIIDGFCALGTQIFMVQGGEPLMYKELKRVIQHIGAKGCYCSMSTNGVLIDKHVDDLAGINKVIISLDGDRELNDSVRGKDVYDRVLANVPLLQERRVPFMFHCVLSRQSTMENSVLPMIDLAKRFHTVLSICNSTETGSIPDDGRSSVVIESDHYRTLAREILKLREAGAPITNSRYQWEHIINWPLPVNQIGRADNLPANHKYLRCLYGRLTAWLDIEGYLYPCPTSYFRNDFRTSIYEQGGIAGAWERLGNPTCLDCVSTGETTTFFSFDRDQLKSVFHYLKRG